MAIDPETLRAQLDCTLATSDLPGLGLPTSEGSRDVYDLGDYHLLVMTDRLDDGTSGTVPFKGEVVTRMATWWLDVAGDLAPSPVERVIDAQALLVRSAEPIGCRIGAWSRLSGALWRAYSSGLRDAFDVTLPDGLAENADLEAPLVAAIDASGAPITPPTDVPRYAEAHALASRTFARGRELARERGVELIDTIYAFGELASGELGSVDLLHAPHVSTYVGTEGSLHEADIVASWRERADGAIDLGGDLPSVLLLDVARAYLDLGDRFIADFAPTTGRAINRLSYSLSAAGILA